MSEPATDEPEPIVGEPLALIADTGTHTGWLAALLLLGVGVIVGVVIIYQLAGSFGSYRNTTNERIAKAEARAAANSRKADTLQGRLNQFTADYAAKGLTPPPPTTTTTPARSSTTRTTARPTTTTTKATTTTSRASSTTTTTRPPSTTTTAPRPCPSPVTVPTVGCPI